MADLGRDARAIETRIPQSKACIQVQMSRRFMAGLSFTWTLRYRGWAFCAISDDHGQAEVRASDVTGGPEHLLRAVRSITQGAATAQAKFEAEPTEFRWFFQRCGSDVKIRLAKAADRSSPDSEDIVIWSGCYAIDALAKAVLDGFDRAVSELGEENYHSQWGRAFPRDDVEALRAAWRQITS
jgi:hypothetical protein